MRRSRAAAVTPVRLLADGLLLGVFLWGCAVCFSTAFSVDVDYGLLLAGCGALTVFYTAVFTLPFRFGLPLLVVGAAGTAALLWQVRYLVWAGWAAVQCAVVNAYAQVFPQIQTIVPIAELTQREWQLALTLIFLLMGLVFGYLLGWALLFCRSLWRSTALVLLVMAPGLVIGLTPAHLPLMVLTGGWCVLLLSSLVQKRDPAAGGRVALAAGGCAAVLLGALTLLLPPDGYRQPQWAAEAGASLTEGLRRLGTGLDLSALSLGSGHGLTAAGSSSHVDLDADALTYDGHTVLRIETDYVGKLYLRGYSAAVYENNAWSPLPEEVYTGWLDENGGLLLSDGSALDANPLNFPALAAETSTYYAITVENLSAPGGCVYFPYQLLSRPGELRGALFQDDAALARELLVRTHTFYFRPDALDLSQWTGLSGDTARAETNYAAQFVPSYYLQLPDGMAEALQAHCQAALDIHMASGPFSKAEYYLAAAQAVSDYLDALAEYDLTASPPPDGSDYVLYFLNESRRGYCMQFASAGTLMLRAMGIPARYVSGFTADSKGGVTEVPDSSAHAWVEVYLDGYGWYPVEMTPGYGLEAGPQASATPEPSATPSAAPTASVPPTGSPSAPPDAAPSQAPQAPESAGPSRWSWLWIPALLAVLVLAAALRRALCLWLRRRRFDGPSSNESVKAIYRYTLSLERRGAPPLPEARALAQQAAFSREGVSRAECQALCRQVEQYAARFASTLSRPRRFLLKWLWALF